MTTVVTDMRQVSASAAADHWNAWYRDLRGQLVAKHGIAGKSSKGSDMPRAPIDVLAGICVDLGRQLSYAMDSEMRRQRGAQFRPHSMYIDGKSYTGEGGGIVAEAVRSSVLGMDVARWLSLPPAPSGLGATAVPWQLRDPTVRRVIEPNGVIIDVHMVADYEAFGVWFRQANRDWHRLTVEPVLAVARGVDPLDAPGAERFMSAIYAATSSIAGASLVAPTTVKEAILAGVADGKVIIEKVARGAGEVAGTGLAIAANAAGGAIGTGVRAALNEAGINGLLVIAGAAFIFTR